MKSLLFSVVALLGLLRGSGEARADTYTVHATGYLRYYNSFSVPNKTIFMTVQWRYCGDPYWYYRNVEVATNANAYFNLTETLGSANNNAFVDPTTVEFQITNVTTYDSNWHYYDSNCEPLNVEQATAFFYTVDIFPVD